MNKSLLSSALMVSSLCATAAAANFSVSGAGGAIPDYTAGGVWNTSYTNPLFSSTVSVANPVTSITKVKLTTFTHTWRGDLQILLRNPAGAYFTVVSRPGWAGAGFGDAGNYLSGTYDIVDAGGGSVAQGAVDIPGGTYNQFSGTAGGLWTGAGITNGPLSGITGAAGTWTLEIRDWAGADIGSLASWTLEGTDAPSAPGVVFCEPGVGGVISCVCSNPNPAGQGCANSAAVGGTISGAGTASVSADSLVLSAGGMFNGTACIFLQGDGLAAGGAGVPFFSGIRCVGGSLIRLYVKGGVQPTGTSSAPVGADPTISAVSAGYSPPQPISAGNTRYYQVYYRDTAAPPPTGSCPAINTANVTTGYTVIWSS